MDEICFHLQMQQISIFQNEKVTLPFADWVLVYVLDVGGGY
jgi:hypothetical protein